MYGVFFLFVSLSYSQSDLETINTHIKNSEFETASVKIKTLIKNTKPTKLNKDPSIYFAYSKLLKGLGKADSSYYFLKKVEPLILSKNNKDSILLMYTLKAEISRFDLKKYLTDKNIDDADRFYKKNIGHNFNLDVLANFFNRKAACLNQYHFGNEDTLKLVIELSDKVIALKDKISDKNIIAYSMNEKAHVFDYNFDRNKARFLFEEAYNFAKSNGLEIPMGDIAINRARNYRFTNNKDKAIEVLLEVLPIAQKNNQLGQVIEVSGLLCATYHEMALYKQALKYKEIQRVNERQLFILQKAKLINEADFKQIIAIKSKEVEQKTKEASTTKKFLIALVIILVLIILGVVSLYLFSRKLKKKNIKLEQLSTENKFLLSEANHRINNNLQLIIVLINQQLKKLDKSQQVNLKDVLSKIESIATLHRHLYRNEDKNVIDLQKYLNEILINFNEIFVNNKIELNKSIQKATLPTDMAMYLGLLLTELCINSVKHAFKNTEEKIIHFNLFLKSNELYFNYKDNGSGISNLNVKPKLINQLCRQIKVDYSLETDNEFTFSFVKKYKK